MTGKYSSPDALEAGDFRRDNPRFQADNLRHNLKLLPALQAVAQKHGCTPAQIALAWLLGRYERLVAIPGTRSVARLEENCRAAHVALPHEDIAQLDAVFTEQAVHGQRYPQEGMKGANA